MKKLILPALFAAALPALGAIQVSYPSNPIATVTVTETPIGQDSIVAETTVTLKDGKASYTTQSLGAATVRFSIDDRRLGTVYSSAPAELITIDIPADGIAQYGGSQLMQDINRINNAAAPLEAEFADLRTLAQTNPEEAQQKYEAWVPRYYAVFNDFIAANPESVAVPYAILNLDTETFMDNYNALTPGARTSILMPLLDRQKESVEKQLAAEKRMQEMQSGSYPAPAFTLPNLEGKQVSLADFRGKWVVLDFWGAWCRWCIKGFPDLKEAYKNAAGKFEVIGIDNRDTPERWKEAVAKYELPWVNVYNDTESPAGAALLESYAVQGFPTKVIIDPQGVIRNITVGEDPNFFTILGDLLK